MLQLSAQEEERSADLHRSSIIVDSLALSPVLFSQRMTRVMDSMIDGGFPISRILGEISKVDARDLVHDRKHRAAFREFVREAGVTAVSRTSGAFFGERAWTFKSAVGELALWSYKFDVLADTFVKVLKADDVRRAKKEKKLGIISNLQNTTHFEDNLEDLDLLYDLGVRIVQLTYNTSNLVADGCVEPNDAGLSLYGYDVVERMNELGIIVDLSHCSRKTALDAAAASKDPVAFTHIACKALTKQSRTKTDEEMQAVAEKGGYLGITSVPAFVGHGKRAKLEDYLDHLDYAVKLVGAKSIGIASDWPASDFPSELLKEINKQASATLKYRWRKGERPVDWTDTIEGLESYSKLSNITRGMVSRGYSDKEIRGILGENFLRIFQRVAG
jgi:membrane dipeptidase